MVSLDDTTVQELTDVMRRMIPQEYRQHSPIITQMFQNQVKSMSHHTIKHDITIIAAWWATRIAPKLSIEEQLEFKEYLDLIKGVRIGDTKQR